MERFGDISWITTPKILWAKPDRRFWSEPEDQNVDKAFGKAFGDQTSLGN